MCIRQPHIDLVPLESKTGLMEDWQNSFATFGICPEIKWLSLLSAICFYSVFIYPTFPVCSNRMGSQDSKGMLDSLYLTFVLTLAPISAPIFTTKIVKWLYSKYYANYSNFQVEKN